MTCSELRDVLLLHAAGVVEPEEEERVRRHLLSGCPACAGSQAEAQATLAHLAYSLAPATPAPGVRERLLLQVAASGQPPVAQALLSRGAARRSGRLLALAAGAAFSLLTGAFIAWQLGRPDAGGSAALVAQKQRIRDDAERIRHLELRLAELARADRLVRSSGVSIATMSGLGPQPSAAGRLFWDREKQTWCLFAFDLRPPPAGRVYQLWFITADERRVSAGVFSVDEEGKAELVVNVPIGIGTIVIGAVTEEPWGGVEAPTGEVQLLGRFST